MKLFGRKKQLEKQLHDLTEQRQQQEQERRWNDLQMQERIRLQEEKHRREREQWELQQRELQRIELEKIEKQRLEVKLRENNERQKIQQEKMRTVRMKMTSPQALRTLRDLIRTRYQLDMYIWSLRGARAPDRPLIIEKMEKSDAVLMEIHAMVGTWEENSGVWTPEEWRVAQQIKQRILADGKRKWVDNPPWNEN